MWSRSAWSRSAPVRSLVLFYVAGSVAAFLAAADPVSAQTPRSVLFGLGVKAVVCATLIYLIGDRMPRLGFDALIAVSALGVSIFIAHAAATGGAAIGGFVYLVMVIYAAHYGGERRALAHAAAVSVMLGIALMVNPLPGAPVVWIVVSLALFAVGESVGRVVDQLHRQISTDSLTGVLSRAGLVAAATRAIQLARRTGQPLSMVVIDLDDFKAVNDTWGHAEGDRVLKAVCASWLAHLRAGDMLARMGGDEFVAILPATEGMAACGVAERLVDTAGFTCSAGVSVLQSSDDLDALLARADKDMYRAKSVRDMYRVKAAGEPDSAADIESEPILPLAEPA